MSNPQNFVSLPLLISEILARTKTFQPLGISLVRISTCWVEILIFRTLSSETFLSETV